MPTKIELLKVRDFGEIITDSFGFARQNFKQLVKCFFVFSGFFMLAGALLMALHQSKVLNEVTSGDFGESRSVFGGAYSNLGADYWSAVFLLVVGYINLQVSVLSYMAIYREKGNVAATLEEVWGYVKYFFLRLFGSAILLGIMMIGAVLIVFAILFAISSSNTYLAVFLAFLLCIVPVIYIYPIFSMIFPTIVFENGSFGYAFRRSFTIIKRNWWATFGALFIMGLITWIASFVILVPVVILNMINLITHMGKATSFSMVTTIVTAVLESLSHMLYIVPIITVSLCYFNLTEQLDGEGLLSRISLLGTVQPAREEDNKPDEDEEDEI
jgi:hypothetical protein